MKSFLFFCYFALFSWANAKSTPPPPGGQDDDNDNDDDGGGDGGDGDYHAQVPRWKLATSALESRGGCSTIKSSTRCRQ